ncbi:tRNA uridine-5-carboxymethylaminomethyl(34) synthesis GTPase MnmE [Sphingorhabdus lutea]|uniref:tRNA modification GTPase MnmE n=1 Tax=Sphingorhabdus lutea TaxID=1913578 RepID=A0A1L3JE98_9SPHN|nr:tRNA uridine-5-carboxymethylaminomethyl(34) synthesis GTPase MnmE [Sphingorhabdus lutea]APG63468.1 tRNA uridine-5-carboxymethylaminomethyl(34) synthesis GTPase MnmE [Sphingorhabdus lutea]
MHEDTIFALSSGSLPAALAIVRISGPSALKAVQTLAGRVPPPRRASLCNIYNPVDEGLLDQAIIIIFNGPDTATGEDLAELHLHGGKAVVRAVEAVLSDIDGLRHAEAGEFTRRAFMNGRMDLNEADGLADLLSAETEYQRRAAINMAMGHFGQQIYNWQEEILKLSALVEAELDFSDEDDVDDNNIIQMQQMLEKLSSSIEKIANQPTTNKLQEGINVVLAGPPNIGKSTLLNALVGRDAAIVSDIAGTTRDVIDVAVAIDGVAFRFLDTAGLRELSDDPIEKIGIDRARAAFELADIILWLGEEGEGPVHPQLVEIDAKADLSDIQRKSEIAIQVSAKTHIGIDILRQKLLSLSTILLPPLDGYALNQRQKTLLDQANLYLADAILSHDWIIIGENLRLVRGCFDKLTGQSHVEDMLDTLFGRFCIGK